MKFWAIFRYEFRYQWRHVSTWLLLVFFLLFGFGILRIVTLTDETHLNAPGTIVFFTVFASAIWVVIGGVIVGDVATRDRQTQMHPLVYTTPVSKVSYLGARLLAALALNALLLLSLFAGFLLSVYGPGATKQLTGPFRLATYLTSYGFLALPTIVAATAIQFAFAALSGRAIASYVASIVLILFSQFAGTTVRFALDWNVLGRLMDLLGTSLVADMEAWTPIDKNTRLILLEGLWLWNRLSWLGLAVGALLFTYARFRMDHPASGRTWRLFRGRSLPAPPRPAGVFPSRPGCQPDPRAGQAPLFWVGHAATAGHRHWGNLVLVNGQQQLEWAHARCPLSARHRFVRTRIHGVVWCAAAGSYPGGVTDPNPTLEQPDYPMDHYSPAYRFLRR